MLRNKGTFMLKNMMLSLFSRFYAKSESDLVSQQALPDYTQNIQIDLPHNDNPLNSIEYELVAPENGYICLLDCHGSPRGHSLIMCNGFTNGIVHPNLAIDSYVTFAVKKGQTYTIRYCGTGSFVRFVRTIGGGYKELFKQFRRACVCLKTSLDCFAKLSSRVRKSGFKTQLLFKIREIFFCLGSPLQATKRLSTWRQRMVCSSASFVQKPRIKSGSFATLTMPERLECILTRAPMNGLNAFIAWRRGHRTESGLQQLCQKMTHYYSSRSISICGGALC